MKLYTLVCTASLWWDTFFKRTKEHPSHILPKPNEKQQSCFQPQEANERKKINFIFCCSLSKPSRLMTGSHTDRSFLWNDCTISIVLALFQVLWIPIGWPNKFWTGIWKTNSKCHERRNNSSKFVYILAKQCISPFNLTIFLTKYWKINFNFPSKTCWDTLYFGIFIIYQQFTPFIYGSLDLKCMTQ